MSTRTDLEAILSLDGWSVRSALAKYTAGLDPNDYTKPRTPAQNNSLWLWFTLLADELNNGGFSVQMILKEKMDIDWNKDLIADLLWRPAQQAILGKTSTKELSKLEDIDKVFDHLTRHLGEKFGIEVPLFPSNQADPAPLISQ